MCTYRRRTSLLSAISSNACISDGMGGTSAYESRSLHMWKGTINAKRCTWYILLNLCSILNKIWLYKICRFMHSFFIYILHSCLIFLELWNKVLLWQNGSDSFKIQHCIFLLWRMPCALGFFAHLRTGRFLYRVSPFYLLNSLASAVVAVAMIPFHFFLAVEKHQYVSMVYNSQC